MDLVERDGLVAALRKSGQIVANSVSWAKAGERMLEAADRIETLEEMLGRALPFVADYEPTPPGKLVAEIRAALGTVE